MKIPQFGKKKKVIHDSTISLFMEGIPVELYFIADQEKAREKI